MAKMELTVLDYDHLLKGFEAPVMKYDCGKMCAPLNGGEPVCCTTTHAVPVMNKKEWELLYNRTKLWHRYRPRDAHERELADDLDDTIVACECEGPQFCERENRSLSCRTFPFFPYITREGEFIGISYYWSFEDRCWVLSNLQRVEKEYLDEFVAAFEFIFEREPEEREMMRAHSATMRRVFSRWDRPIPLMARDGRWMQIMPRGGGVHLAGKKTFKKHGPYRSPKAYRRAVREAEEEFNVGDEE